jgi:hypothetical protein
VLYTTPVSGEPSVESMILIITDLSVDPFLICLIASPLGIDSLTA